MKNINSVKLLRIKSEFVHLKNKKILIYGSGVNAKLFIEALPDFNIVAILDRTRYEGSIQNIPIITWDEVNKDTADVIIIACNRKNFREIFLRIRHYGEIFNMDIYNFSGQNLSHPYYYADYTYEERQCLKYSKQDLFNAIDAHDAISFDLFDTLVMRKVLEPTDIFDIVERNITKYGIDIYNFKKKRRTAELNAKGADIFAIYKNLKNSLNLTDEQLSFVRKEELACEKANIITRDCIIEAFNYAVKKGKIVSIVSNMYLPYGIMQDILDNVGIKGYNNLFISCEYGKGKSQGLFQVYKEKIGKNVKCLHIGDDYFEDILAAEKNGITAFYINSSLELLKMSKIRKLLLNSYCLENRVMIGLIISKLFNNPFVLYNTDGFVPISDIKTFTEIFITPIVHVYMKKLLKCLHSNQYDGIIFPARDGYIFSHLYDKYRKYDASLPQSHYVTISRKVAVSISQFNFDDIQITLEKYVEENKDIKFWKQIMRFNSDDDKEILKESKKKREMYIDYIKNIGINTEKKYLFCELISSGTSHIALNNLFNQNLDGFYLGGWSRSELGDLITYIYPPEEKNNITSRIDILEAVLSSPNPSASGIDSNGNIFYEPEERTKDEINMMLDMHRYIEEYEDTLKSIGEIDLDLSNNLMGLVDGIKLYGEAELFRKRQSIETMTMEKISVMRRV